MNLVRVKMGTVPMMVQLRRAYKLREGLVVEWRPVEYSKKGNPFSNHKWERAKVESLGGVPFLSRW